MEATQLGVFAVSLRAWQNDCPGGWTKGEIGSASKHDKEATPHGNVPKEQALELGSWSKARSPMQDLCSKEQPWTLGRNNADQSRLELPRQTF